MRMILRLGQGGERNGKEGEGDCDFGHGYFLC